MTTTTPEPVIEWYDIANLLFGDLVVEPDAIQKLADQLEKMRLNIQSTQVPVINTIDDARLVYSQLAYKISVMENELLQFKVGHKSKYAPKPITNLNPATEKDILAAISDKMNTFVNLRTQLDQLVNRIEDSSQVAAINLRLAEVFG